MIHFSSSISGLDAAQFRLSRTGHDLANVNTRGFSQGQVSQVERFDGGTAINQVKKVANNDPRQMSNTDVAEEMGEMIQSSGSYKANLKVTKTQDEMLGDLLDTVG